MSLPTAVFLDTSILAGQQYNFASTAISSFIPVATAKKLVLVLPDPTRREVTRQIRDRSIAAYRALEDARRRAPFLVKWRHFPNLPAAKIGDWEVQRVAVDEWEAFLSQFSVVRLGYEGIRVEEIMNWYDSVRAPFGDGKKRKEFPDAFAIAALAVYAQKSSKYIAVVSEDPDFRAACGDFPGLLYFPSLPALTEVLLSDDARLNAIRAAVLKAQGLLEVAITEEASATLAYYHRSGHFDINGGDVDTASILDIRVVGIGDAECTVTFEAEVTFSVSVEFLVRASLDDETDTDMVSEKVVDHDEVSGIAKLRFSSDRSGIEKVTYVSIDQSELVVTARPLE